MKFQSQLSYLNSAERTFEETTENIQVKYSIYRCSIPANRKEIFVRNLTLTAPVVINRCPFGERSIRNRHNFCPRFFNLDPSRISRCINIFRWTRFARRWKLTWNRFIRVSITRCINYSKPRGVGFSREIYGVARVVHDPDHSTYSVRLSCLRED